MKKTQDILELPLISITDGLKIGQIKELVVNPDGGTIDYLLIGGERWYEGPKVLAFNAVLGIGDDAVTTEGGEQVKLLAEQNGAGVLLARGIKVIDTRVMTKKGRFIGQVTEYLIDEETGKIKVCEYKPINGGGLETIPADQVVTYGRDVLVVAEAGSSKNEEPAPAEDANRQPSAAELFEARQRQYILGKKASRTIIAENGSVIINEGDVITEEVIEMAKATGRFTELTMNIQG